jgi:protein arginine N-methyltransferase 1
MSNIVKSAKKIVEDNNLADKIEIIQGKVEEITLPVEKVRKFLAPFQF